MGIKANFLSCLIMISEGLGSGVQIPIVSGFPSYIK